MAKIPRLTVRCEYPGGSSLPSEVSFRLSPSYGLHTAREAHDWFLLMMRSHDEFVVETDRAGEAPMPFGNPPKGLEPPGALPTSNATGYLTRSYL